MQQRVSLKCSKIKIEAIGTTEWIKANASLGIDNLKATRHLTEMSKALDKLKGMTDEEIKLLIRGTMWGGSKKLSNS